MTPRYLVSGTQCRTQPLVLAIFAHTTSFRGPIPF